MGLDQREKLVGCKSAFRLFLSYVNFQENIYFCSATEDGLSLDFVEESGAIDAVDEMDKGDDLSYFVGL